MRGGMKVVAHNLAYMVESRTLSALAPIVETAYRRQLRTAFGVVLWAVLITGSWVVGTLLLARPEPDMDLDAAPLFGRFSFDLSPQLILPVVTAALVMWTSLKWSSHAWPRLLGTVFLAAALWAISLAVSDGLDAIAAPLNHPTDYLAALPIDSPLSFLDRYIDRLGELPLHVRSHPPGPVLLLALLSNIGLEGAEVAAGLVILVGASAAPAALLALRSIAGEERARAAAPFLVLAPGALWIATSMDALFMGLSAWAVAALVAASGRRDRTGDLVALVGGLLFGVALFFSYGIGPVALVPLTVAAARRRFRPLLLGGAGVLLIVGAFAYGGFWWFDGLSAAIRHYGIGISRYRPDDYFLMANVAALGVAVGPATAAGLAAMRDKRLWLLAGAALGAVLAANLSGLSKGEVERIWLPFMPWLLVAAGTSDKAIIPWCCAQAGWTILIQAGVQTPW